MSARKTAADATIDIFSGRTIEEHRDEARRIAESADIVEHKERKPETFDAYEARLTQYMSQNFKSLDGFSLTGNGKYWYLERIRENGTTYSGLVMSADDLLTIAKLFYKAVKEAYGGQHPKD